jgi:hypothetical protein
MDVAKSVVNLLLVLGQHFRRELVGLWVMSKEDWLVGASAASIAATHGVK